MTDFLVVWLILLAVLILAIAGTIFAINRFRKSLIVPHAALWSLRIYSGITSALHIPMFVVLLAMADCDYGEFDSLPGKNTFFSTIDCVGDIPSIVGLCASALAALFFGIFVFSQAFIAPSDPHSPSIFKRSHSRMEAATVLVHLCLVVSAILLRHYSIVFAIVYLVCQTMLLVGWLVLQPLHIQRIQDTQCAFAALPVWAGVCFLILTIAHTASSADWNNAISLLFAVGIVPTTFATGILSSFLRKKLARLGKKAVLSVQDNPQKLQEALEAYDPTASLGITATIKCILIEIAARQVVSVQNINVNVACSIIRRGLVLYPQSEYLRLQYCYYLLLSRTQTDAALFIISTCDRLRLDDDQMLAVYLFRREAALQARTNQLGGGARAGSETFDEVELKQRLHDARLLFLKCQQLLADIWNQLQKDAAHQYKRRNGASAAISGDNNGSRLVAVRKNGRVHPVQDGVDEHGKPKDGDDDDENAANDRTLYALSSHAFNSILTHLENLREEERKADAAFEFLFSQSPESPEILHEFAQYVRGVKLDEATAKELEMRRDMAIVSKEAAAKRELKKSNGDDEDDSSDEDGSGSSSSRSESVSSASSSSSASERGGGGPGAKAIVSPKNTNKNKKSPTMVANISPAKASGISNWVNNSTPTPEGKNNNNSKKNINNNNTRRGGNDEDSLGSFSDDDVHRDLPPMKQFNKKKKGPSIQRDESRLKMDGMLQSIDSTNSFRQNNNNSKSALSAAAAAAITNYTLVTSLDDDHDKGNKKHKDDDPPYYMQKKSLARKRSGGGEEQQQQQQQKGNGMFSPGRQSGDNWDGAIGGVEDEKSSYSSGESSRFSNDHTVLKEKTEMLKLVTKRISRLKMKLRLSTLLLLCFSSGLLWVFVGFAANALVATTDTDFSGLRRFGCSQLAFQSRRMYVAAVKGDTDTFKAAAEILYNTCTEMNTVHSVLAHDRKIYSSRLRSFYDEPNVKIREIRDDYHFAHQSETEEAVITGSEAIEMIIASGLVVAQSNETDFFEYDLDEPSTFSDFFLLLDSFIPVFRAMDTATLLTVKEVDLIVYLCITIMACLSAAALLAESLIILGIFRPAARNLFSELNHSVSRLSAISRGDRATFASRFRAVRDQAETEAEEMKRAESAMKGGSASPGLEAGLKIAEDEASRRAYSPSPQLQPLVASAHDQKRQLRHRLDVEEHHHHQHHHNRNDEDDKMRIDDDIDFLNDGRSDSSQDVTLAPPVIILPSGHSSSTPLRIATTLSPVNNSTAHWEGPIIAASSSYMNNDDGENSSAAPTPLVVAGSRFSHPTSGGGLAGSRDGEDSRARSPASSSNGPSRRGSFSSGTFPSSAARRSGARSPGVRFAGAECADVDFPPPAAVTIAISSSGDNNIDNYSAPNSSAFPSSDGGQAPYSNNNNNRKNSIDVGEDESSSTENMNVSSGNDNSNNNKNNTLFPQPTANEMMESKLSLGADPSVASPTAAKLKAIEREEAEEVDTIANIILPVVKHIPTNAGPAAAATSGATPTPPIGRTGSLPRRRGSDPHNASHKEEDGAEGEKKKSGALTMLSSNKSNASVRRQRALEKWYAVCMFFVVASLVVVFVLGHVSTSKLSTASRQMNNVARRRDFMTSMTWLSFELMQCYDASTSICGGIQYGTNNEDITRCYLKELIVAASKAHEGDLDGSDGWQLAKARAIQEGWGESDWSTRCSLFTDQKDLYEIGIDLGIGVVKQDSRMSPFMFSQGQCLADPSIFDGIPVLSSDDRTAREVAKFSTSKCKFFSQADPQTMNGLNRLFEDVMLNYKFIAHQSILTDSVLELPTVSFNFLMKYTQESEEWALGLQKGALLMEANVLETFNNNLKIVAAAYSVLVLVSFVQLIWLGSRIHKTMEDNMHVAIIVQRMIRLTIKQKEANARVLAASIKFIAAIKSPLHSPRPM